eukprot:m.336759 g.336759  ORF g.336759 m.336759 type:complete len:249 (-) comp17953_c0_seq1:1615-2361(-)
MASIISAPGGRPRLQLNSPSSSYPSQKDTKQTTNQSTQNSKYDSDSQRMFDGKTTYLGTVLTSQQFPTEGQLTKTEFVKLSSAVTDHVRLVTGCLGNSTEEKNVKMSVTDRGMRISKPNGTLIVAVPIQQILSFKKDKTASKDGMSIAFILAKNTDPNYPTIVCHRIGFTDINTTELFFSVLRKAFASVFQTCGKGPKSTKKTEQKQKNTAPPARRQVKMLAWAVEKDDEHTSLLAGAQNVYEDDVDC